MSSGDDGASGKKNGIQILEPDPVSINSKPPGQHAPISKRTLLHPKKTVRYAGLGGEGSELTEEDIFTMKQLRPHPQGSLDPTDQSVMSLADSTSNFGEHVPTDDGEATAEGSEANVGGDFEEMSNQGGPDDDYDEGDESESGSLIDERYLGQFVFHRPREDDPVLPESGTVSVLHYPFDPPQTPEGEEDAEFQAAFAQSKAYVVGTAHFSPESQQDVLKTIEATQPDLVMVELCPSRLSVLSLNEELLLEEAKSLNYEKMITTIKQSQTIPGCRLILGDRPIQITLQRALGSLNLWQRIRLFWHILVSHNSTISQEDVERCKKSDLLEELLREMAGEFPELTRIFVAERDQYMANGLRTLLRNTTLAKRVAAKAAGATWQPVTVVAVVGIGHVPGITAQWDQRIDVHRLLTVPQPSRFSRFAKLAVKGALLGVLAVCTYKVGAFAYFRYIKPA